MKGIATFRGHGRLAVLVGALVCTVAIALAAGLAHVPKADALAAGDMARTKARVTLLAAPKANAARAGAVPAVRDVRVVGTTKAQGTIWYLVSYGSRQGYVPAAKLAAHPSASSVYTNPTGTILDEPKSPKKQFKVFTIAPGDAVYRRIIGKSYRKNKRIKLTQLRYLKVLHRNFDGATTVGEIIVNKRIAMKVKTVFYKLYLRGYQIRSMRLIDDFWVAGKDGNRADLRSIRADNTSAFCYRTISGTKQLSNHARGLAIDLNPLENPSLQSGKVKGVKASIPYGKNRTPGRPHVITKKDAAYKLFRKRGFKWGGAWRSPDYQHFEHR